MHSEELSAKREKALGYLMGRAHRIMGLQFQNAFEKAGLDITKEQWELLVDLWIKDGQNQQELAKNVFKDKGSITRTLDAMEAMSLVVRVEDKQDRRNKQIYLTAKGRNLKDITFPIVWKIHENALEGISTEEIKICRKVMTRIYQNLVLSGEEIVEEST